MRKGDLDIVGFSAFLFVPDNLGIYYINSRLILVNGYHIGVMTVINSKLINDGGFWRYLWDVGYRGFGVIQNSDVRKGYFSITKVSILVTSKQDVEAYTNVLPFVMGSSKLWVMDTSYRLITQHV